MPENSLRNTEFVGKIIKKVDKSTCNEWIFHFTDGTKTSIEVECTGIPNLYGMKATKIKTDSTSQT